MSSYWLTDPELFLYAKGPNDVILRRCKKLASSSSSGSSLVVPMKSNDFDYVSSVENHLELIGGMDKWEEPDYKRLVKYIYDKRLLVNGQGLVIAEIYKPDDANEIPIYIRSLDVLPLKPYIPNLTERPIPLRTIKYLGDVNGKAAMMEEEDSNVITKLTARVDDLEYKNKTLEVENKTLDTSVTQLTASLATITGNVVDLQFKNKTLEAENKTLDTSVTQLTSGLATMTGNVVDLQSKNETLNSNVKTLEGKVTKLTADLVTQMNALRTLQQDQAKYINANTKEVWRNDLTNCKWVGIEELISQGPFNILIVNQLGTFTVDHISTNVRARYWYKIKINDLIYEYTAISPEDLTPSKEKVKFQPGIWYSFKSTDGKTYVYCLSSSL